MGLLWMIMQMPVTYGTSFEDLEDETRDPISKKPTAIHDQVATDDRGRRRFHGAFTGGFSAGYFNTVGSKHGWVPQEFRSTRSERAEKSNQMAEDFMDAEDLGEFGISSRRIRQTDEFARGNNSGQFLAWERAGSQASTATAPITSSLASMLRPVASSIGTKMLRSMGWRDGKAVGLASIVETREKKNTDEVDREQLARIAPQWVASPEDEQVVQMEPVTTNHGLGYTGALQGGSLDQKYGQIAADLKGKKGRGIRGQAFGVGAFEDDDDSIYTSVDLSQYDFSIGGVSDNTVSSAPDATFVLASKDVRPRKFYPPPKLPPNFRPDHIAIPMPLDTLPAQLRQVIEELTAEQKAKLLGENRKADSAASAPRRNRTSRWDVKGVRDVKEHEERTQQEMAERVEYPTEPMKQARFKEYLRYVRRGLHQPQPRDMSVWEWEAEKADFEGRLLPDERAMLPDVKMRMKPLAKTALALPLIEMMKSKFVGETNKDTVKSSQDSDRVMAVRSNAFGEKTREKLDWYPSFGLCKMFNVPNPYPHSSIVGLVHLQKKAKSDSMATLGLSSTAAELTMRSSFYEEESKEPEEEDDDESQDEDDRVPQSFFTAIFGNPEESSSDSEPEPEKEIVPSSSKEVLPSIPRPLPDDHPVITVMDLPTEYGPSMPPAAQGDMPTAFSVIRFNKEESKRRKRKRKEKKESKDRKRKKEKKHKKDKKKKRKRERQSSSSSSSGSSVEVIS